MAPDYEVSIGEFYKTFKYNLSLQLKQLQSIEKEAVPSDSFFKTFNYFTPKFCKNKRKNYHVPFHLDFPIYCPGSCIAFNCHVSLSFFNLK